MRPQFHFTASSGWINDPHGISFRDGAYDAFYQYVPGSLEWASDCRWGHAVGPDLLSLSEREVALAPGDGDDGIWTGVLVRGANGDDRIFYTAVTEPGIGIGRVRVATPADDRWNAWVKGDVVVDAPPGLDLVAYRDPFVLAEPDGSWRMFVGAAFADGRAAALVYHSRELDSWTYEGVAVERSTVERDPVWMGALWECPQIMSLDGRHVIITSVWDADVLHYAAYATGSYAEGRFGADHWGRLTYGPSYYAPSYFRDAADLPSVIFWFRGVRDDEQGWAGAHSVPYRVQLDGDRIVLTPHPDLLSYRGRISETGRVHGLAAYAEWMPGESLSIQSEGTVVAELSVDGSRLTLRVGREEWEMPCDGGPVRVTIDGPVLEVCTDRGLIGAPIAPAGSTIELLSDTRLEVWPLVR